RQQRPRWPHRDCARGTPGRLSHSSRPNPGMGLQTSRGDSFHLSFGLRAFVAPVLHPDTAQAESAAKLAALLVTHLAPPAEAVAKTIALLRCHAVPTLAPGSVPGPRRGTAAAPEPAKQDPAQHEQSNRLPESEHRT